MKGMSVNEKKFTELQNRRERSKISNECVYWRESRNNARWRRISRLYIHGRRTTRIRLKCSRSVVWSHTTSTAWVLDPSLKGWVPPIRMRV
jgi:hypothetical protein